MNHLNTIYRNYDIRGKFPEEITPAEVEKIGKAIVVHFKVKKVAIGRDIRPSADILFKSLATGLTSMGCDVIDLGLTTTPMTYFIAGSTDVDATVMITASHMPSEYNGLKITIEDAKPVTVDILQILKKIVGTHTFSAEETIGQVTTHALQKDWIAQFKARHNLRHSNFSVVIDPANMIGALEVATFKAFEPDITVHTIYEDFDHSCPNHEANPMKYETMSDLGKEVVCKKSNLGIAFDGDADRVGFVDEKGVPVPSDLIGTLLARSVLKKYPKTHVVYDLRSSKSLRDEIIKCGGIPITGKVGHTHIRTQMRECDATLGVELAGHFFFKETFFSEGGPLPAFMIMELMLSEKKTLSTLVAEIQKYHHSGEINSKITQTPDKIYEKLEQKFTNGNVDRTDGLKISFDDWWFNVRPSANDPVMRLTLEADTEEVMKEKIEEILNIIRG